MELIVESTNKLLITWLKITHAGRIKKSSFQQV